MNLLAKLTIGAGTAVVAACATFGGGRTADADAVIRGELTYRQRIALPADAIAVVELRDARSAGAPIAEQKIPLDGKQVPVAFELTVSRAALAAATAPEVRGGVMIDGAPAWASEPKPIAADGGDIALGTIMLAPWKPIAFATEYRCGGKPVMIGVADERMTMRVNGEDFALTPVQTASGAKYEAEGDAETWFWSKGDGGTASVRGEQLADCVKVGGDGKMTSLKARGNEPGWSIDIAGDRLTLVSDYGATRVEAAAVKSVDSAVTVWRAADKDLTVTWENAVCADDATGMPHPARVTVEHAGKTLKGCGGDPKSLLIGGEWIVEDINGGEIIDNSRASLKFDDDGRVAGMSSCNSYGAQYSLSGEGLTISRAAATLRACAPALMNQERKFFDALSKVSGFTIDATGALILTGPDGARILARR